jgi:predicted phage terminase large subunit-like protein
MTLQSWDTATTPGDTNSYNVCTTWGIHENRYFLLGVFRERSGFRDLKEKAMALAREYDPAAILIEAQSSGSPLADELEGKEFPVQLVAPGSASKEQRLYRWSNKFESGRVFLLKGAHWLDTYVDEITTFPDSDFSDQVDSTSQALGWDKAVGNTNFANSLRTIQLLSGTSATHLKMRKLLVKEGGGTHQFSDGRPNLIVPESGAILELDEETAARLAGTQPNKYLLLPD